MHIDILTLFPEICAPLNQSIIGRAEGKGNVKIAITNFRSFAKDNRKTVDDTPYGGGAGMVLQGEALKDAIQSKKLTGAKIIVMSPQGRPFNQVVAQELAKEEHLVFICGHYEGIDERFIQNYCDEELSIGDYILTNGTLAAIVVTDAIVRLLPNVLGSSESIEEESFDTENLLEYPQFTKPKEWEGQIVPTILLSGNHKRITDWRRHLRYLRTLKKRPDLFTNKNPWR